MSDFKAADLLSDPAVPGLLGSIIALRAVKGATWLLRFSHLFSSWACAYLFGPPIANAMGMMENTRAFAAVVGATAIFGLVAIDAMIRYIQETPILDVLAKLLNVFRGGGK